MSRIIVCSPSTKKFVKDKNFIIVNGPPEKDILKISKTFDEVIAIGGGAVIDTAKIISKNPIICYPTTASGSSDTSHSVYWDGENKKNFKSFLPKRVYIKNEFIKNLPENLIFETKCDLISHCLDSIWSKNKNKKSENFAKKGLEIISNDSSNFSLILAGRFGGKAIEITQTNILHAISYPLTGIYNISHGKALSFLIPIISNFMDTEPPKISYTKNLGEIDWDLVLSEAFKYEKINNTYKKIKKCDLEKYFK